jgi:CDP-4-dehydro-6-deoxyglucose reductase
MTEDVRRARVVRRRQLSPRVSELSLEVPGVPPFRWHAGQHVGIHVEGGTPTHGGPLWYSIASAWDGRDPPVLTLAIGSGTGGDILAPVGPGQELGISGPLGEFSLPAAPGVLLVGAGTGVAPLRAFAEEALGSATAVPVVLAVGARSREDLLWYDELSALAARTPRFSYVPVLSQPDPTWSGRSGYVQRHVRELAQALPPDFVVRACGSEAMVRGVREVLAELGVPGERIDSQSYA